MSFLLRRAKEEKYVPNHISATPLDDVPAKTSPPPVLTAAGPETLIGDPGWDHFLETGARSGPEATYA